MIAKKLNNVSFYLALLFVAYACYSFYAFLDQKWQVHFPNEIFLIICLALFILGLIGFRGVRNGKDLLKSWTTVSLTLLLCLGLLLIVLFKLFWGGSAVIMSTESPDEAYSIDFYSWDQGATGSFGIRGELQGPLWFKKAIYLEEEVDNVKVNWKSNSMIEINGKQLELKNGETYGYE
ncbi:DUF5412 family protein [Bacillus sp. B1-b2]|uniref:DUF5412 family protein n=1 Tax=Bacillus sp. B1-b2 TaxID=2653201 RepID=UPI001261625A|nr:DUF5412 family protein [Bacillus sp. B1-b2]